MVRTQIYLTQQEQKGLRDLSRRTGVSQSQLIRQAVDSLLAEENEIDRIALLREARGMWRDRDDLPDFPALRRELDRFDPEPI